MNRFWSVLFWLVPIGAFALYGLSLANVWPMQRTWLPENISTSGQIIDQLFNLIHVICAVIFLLTSVVLAIALWKYRSRSDHQASPRHSHVILEVVWSVIPAGILIFLSLYQYDSWADNKMRRPTKTVAGVEEFQPALALIKAKQFGWEVYYPGPDGELGTLDDIYVENELLVPANEDVVLQLESRDVIHSFFVPALRVKQDIVPGMKHFCWFHVVDADPERTYEIACTELCGWGHYKMKGVMRVLSRPDFDRQMEILATERMKTGNESFDEGAELP